MSGRLLWGRPLMGWLLACVVLCIWSGWIIVARLGATRSLSVWDITALRFGTAGILILPWALKWGLGGLSLPRALWLAISCGAPYAAAAFIGFLYAPAAHGAVLVNGTLPLFTVLLGWAAVGIRPSGAQALGVLLVLAGCAAIGGDGLLSPVAGQWKGHLFFLLSSALLSGYMIAARAWNVTRRQTLAAVPVGSLLLFLPIYLGVDLPSLLKHTPLAAWPWDEVLLQAGYQGVLVSLLALPVFTKANALLGAAAMAAFLAAVPSVTLLLAIPLLGEVPSLLAVAGVGVVTLGVLCTIGLVRPKREAATG